MTAAIVAPAAIARAAAPALPRRLAAEALGTGLLVAIVIGSGIMAARLAGGNQAVALLANTIATGAGLVALIAVLAPVSGAHLNPAVTLAEALRGAISRRTALAYGAAQGAGAIAGVAIAHAMFALPLIEVASRRRDAPGQALSEFVATFGLVTVIRGCPPARADAVPWLVGLYIVAAYWFTASTSFANPAVTIARALSDSFAGIAPASVPPFLIAQAAGAIAATLFAGWLFEGGRSRP